MGKETLITDKTKAMPYDALLGGVDFTYRYCTEDMITHASKLLEIMTYYYYVYLKLDTNKLVITESRIDDSNYQILMNNNGCNRQELFNTCKIFCLGYLSGSNNGGRNEINNQQEFV